MKTNPRHCPLLRLLALGSTFGVLACALPAGRAATPPATTAAHSISHADRPFVEKAVQSGRDEVALARIAVDRSTNPEVKKFAQMMIDDHSRANEEVAALASSRGVELKDKTKVESKWTRKDPKDFDRAYIKRMVADHKKDIDLFGKESKNGSDAELVDFARKTLRTLEHHLEEADRLDKSFR